MSALAPNYKRKNLSFVRGKGSFLTTTDGKKYLDFVQGIAVNSLGHANKKLIQAINKQSKKLIKNNKKSRKPLKNNLKAICVLHQNHNNISGVIKFTQLPKTLKIEYDIEGLSNGYHGFHVHNYGDLTDNCKNACSHFNPLNKKLCFSAIFSTRSNKLWITLCEFAVTAILLFFFKSSTIAFAD